jgi:hypothetical protein
MAKSQKRSGREPKKPKTSKKKHGLAAYQSSEAHPVQKIVPEGTATKHPSA